MNCSCFLRINSSTNQLIALRVAQCKYIRLYWCLKLWRRGGDSNPRHPFGVKLISSQPCSATPAPLHGRTGRKRTLINVVPRESIASSALRKLPQEVQELYEARSGAGSTWSPPKFSTANPERWRNGFHAWRALCRYCRYKSSKNRNCLRGPAARSCGWCRRLRRGLACTEAGN